MTKILSLLASIGICTVLGACGPDNSQPQKIYPDFQFAQQESTPQLQPSIHCTSITLYEITKTECN